MTDTPPSTKRLWLGWPTLGVLILLVAFLVVFIVWLLRPSPLPGPGSERYEAYVEAFQTGTAALDTVILQPLALESLSKAVDLIPEEPAAWANRGLQYLRDNQLDQAASDLRRASSLAPDNTNIREMLSLLAQRQGRPDEAIAHLRVALKARPDDVRLLYNLNELLAQQSDAAAIRERFELFDRMLQLRPGALLLLSERASFALAQRNRVVLLDTLERLDQQAGSLSAQTREQLAIVKKEVAASSPDATLAIQILQNLLRAEPSYSADADAINPRENAVGTSFQTFLRLAPPPVTPAPRDDELTFVANALPESDRLNAQSVVLPVWLERDGLPVLLTAQAGSVRLATSKPVTLPFPSGKANAAPTIPGILALDWDNDWRTDLVLAGQGGIRFFANKPEAGFVEVTAACKLPAEVLQGDYFGAWACDLDMDGDLDIVLARRQGEGLVLRNNYDGTWLPQSLFAGVSAVRAVVQADFDNDGAADVALLDAAGRLHLFKNQRSGKFVRWNMPDLPGRLLALNAAEVTGEGLFSLVVLIDSGIVQRHTIRGEKWESSELGKVPLTDTLQPGNAELHVVDLDGNGALDLIARSSQAGWALLSDGPGRYTPLATPLPAGLGPIVPLSDTSQLDLIGLDETRLPRRYRVQTSKGYRRMDVRPRAVPVPQGDSRVNSFCIGAEIEARVGTLVVKDLVRLPSVLLGLGNREQFNVMRFVWTNGQSQFEFNRKAEGEVLVQQRLKGSCPYLFSFDGSRWVFVNDFCWNTPLGMYINAQAPGGFVETSEWIRIRPDLLKAHQGRYQLRVNAALWETIYLDQLALQVVDHPPGTEVHVDERFSLVPQKPRLYLTGTPRPVARAYDHRGQEVTDIVRDRDGNYLDRAGRGKYQGITSDHWVEIDLSDWSQEKGTVYLLAHGWLHPTDSSINFNLEQGNNDRPRPLTLEVPDGQNGWKQVGSPLGFPSGKNKTMVIRLDGLASTGVPARLRLRTNLEIYWDALQVALGLDESVCQSRTLQASSAELRYRGLLEHTQANRSSPTIPDPEKVVSRGGLWRDLIGYHTRFGEVSELLQHVDDRYVLMNAGDEILLTFAEVEPPPAGWQRTFLWVSDGWTKDGDLNTRFGDTVLPLPYHGMTDYRTAPGRLQDDPVYRRFPGDWQKYHTRFISPEGFRRGLFGPPR
jgi:tetratricopeptide (TPR) repeat protein